MTSVVQGDPPGWGEVARAVRRRRESMHLTQDAVAACGDVSTGTVRNLEQGSRQSYRSQSITLVDRALDWPAGTIAAIATHQMTAEEASGLPVITSRTSVQVRLRELGEQILRRRLSLGISQAEVERRGGPGEATVRRLERGEAGPPRRQTRQQLATALEVTADSIEAVAEGAAVLLVPAECTPVELSTIGQACGVEPVTTAGCPWCANDPPAGFACIVCGLTRPCHPPQQIEEAS